MKSLFLRWALIGGGLAIAVICFFFHQLWTAGVAWVASDYEGQPVLADADLKSLRGVKFVSEAAMLAQVSVDHLAVLAHEGSRATVSMQLTSSYPVTVYPTLRVFLKAGERTVRTLELGPTEYAHASRLQSEQVRVPIDLRPGETGFTAKAYYPDAEPSK
ncbi:hypothetical protein [Ralstonia pseudosolanacearum]|jgi:hypothetical protein|uniref:DUF3426 domain-containing protein n=1 Tax=Ralstonia pseudosolanacearum TaxID=1310165 RepID=A0A454TLR6_9RALS|nr:hypothetical protein [Ralstonia pseudosolanacearum]RNM03049.1 hypothetical protein EGA29_19990 [Ralstonia pseudosolanacearum]